MLLGIHSNVDKLFSVIPNKIPFIEFPNCNRSLMFTH